MTHRPPKPRITKARLLWKWNRTRAVWDPYHRATWYVDGKRKERLVKLDWKGDRQTLDDLYWQCEAGRHERQKPAPARYSWAALIDAWEKDPRVQGRLSASTVRKYRSVMTAILDKNADKDVRKTTRQHVRAIHDKMADTPRKADWYVQVISLLWNYGKNKRDWPIGDNPASGIDLYGKRRQFEPWPAWMIDKLDDAPDTVRTAAQLILGTGQRPSAAIAMRWDQFDGEWMTVTDEKGGVTFEAYCPAPLRSYLDGLPRAGRHVLPRNLSQPMGYSALEKQFRVWRDSLGERAAPYVLHGLRKLAIVRLAEAGCSDAEIQAVTGQSAEMVAFYRSRASRKRLSKSAHERKT